MIKYILPLLLLSSQAFALNCSPTRNDRDLTYPGKKSIYHSNKLAKPAGKSQFANGRILKLSGRVYDAKCVPISGAIVEIWQTNANGKYILPAAAEFSNPYPLFAGSGRSITDNEGRYFFETIYPKGYGKKHNRRTPHIHFKVQHVRAGRLYTTMYFANENNKIDKHFLKIPKNKRNSLTVATYNNGDTLEANFDIILKGEDPFKDY